MFLNAVDVYFGDTPGEIPETIVSCIFMQLLKNSDTSPNYSFIFTYFSMWLANCFPVDIDKKNPKGVDTGLMEVYK